MIMLLATPEQIIEISSLYA